MGRYPFISTGIKLHKGCTPPLPDASTHVFGVSVNLRILINVCLHLGRAVGSITLAQSEAKSRMMEEYDVYTLLIGYYERVISSYA